MDFLNPKPRRQLTPEALERMREGQYKGLVRAVAKRNVDCSADYATNFDHGQTAPDFVRSAEAAGETREEVRSHLSLVDRTLLTLSRFFKRTGSKRSGSKRSGLKLPRLPLQMDAASPRAPKLARALALLFWRPLRLFRTQEHWEWLALCYRLWQLVRWRQKQGELTVERAEQFREHLDAIVHNFSPEVVPRLKRIEKRFWKVWPLSGVWWGWWRRCSGDGIRGSVFGVRGKKHGTRGLGLGTRRSRLGMSARSQMANRKSQMQNPHSEITDRKSQILNAED